MFVRDRGGGIQKSQGKIVAFKLQITSCIEALHWWFCQHFPLWSPIFRNIQLHQQQKNRTWPLSLEGDIFPFEIIKQIHMDSKIPSFWALVVWEDILYPFHSKNILLVLLHCKWLICNECSSLILFCFNENQKKSFKNTENLTALLRSVRQTESLILYLPPNEYNYSHLLSQSM